MGADQDLIGILFRVAVFFIPFLFSICVHEAAHAWAAKLCGDRTAEHMGRLSLNPLVHIDLLGTIILPIAAVLLPGSISRFIFGWAKPVPFDPRNLKDKKNGPFFIAAAGPFSNLVLALIGAFFWVLIASGYFIGGLEPDKAGLAVQIAQQFVGLNCMLAVLNLVPIHPLDGGKIMARFLPLNAVRWLEEKESMLSMLLLVLFLSGAGRLLMGPVYWLSNSFTFIAQATLSAAGLAV